MPALCRLIAYVEQKDGEKWTERIAARQVNSSAFQTAVQIKKKKYTEHRGLQNDFLQDA